VEKRYVGVDCAAISSRFAENCRTYLREWRLAALPQFVKKLRASDEVAVEATGNPRLFFYSSRPGSCSRHQPVWLDHAIGEEERCQRRPALSSVSGEGVVAGGTDER